jgi:peptide chain release factor
MSAHFSLLLSAGSGPQEVRAFVALLGRRLEALAAAQGLRVLESEAQGEAVAPRSLRLRLEGESLGALAAELGSHALLARSSERGRHARKRWFAHVALLPEPAAPRPFDPREVRTSAARAGGPGGQNVNKVASAVRAVHVPSGLAVRATAERSQRQNRRLALERLEAQLAQRTTKAQEARTREQHALHRALQRGAAVRVYRLGKAGALEPVLHGGT